MKISVEIKGMNAVKAHLAGMSKSVEKAASKAIKKTASGVRYDIVEKVKAETKGGATAYTQRAFNIKQSADGMEATIYLRDDMPGKGSVWQRAIGHLFTGGTRSWKRMEKAFSSAGILPSGMQMVPASSSWAMKLDQYGNAPKGQIVQLISYFNAFSESGFRANMSDKRRKSLAKAGKSAEGYKTINGVMYFVSHGKGKGSHLPAGIWAKRGTHGSDVAPVFLFVRSGTYRKRFDIEAIGTRTVSRVWQRNFDSELAYQMRAMR